MASCGGDPNQLHLKVTFENALSTNADMKFQLRFIFFSVSILMCKFLLRIFCTLFDINEVLKRSLYVKEN